MKLIVVALALTALAAPGLAVAQPAPAPVASMAGLTEKDRLSAQLVHTLFAAEDFDFAAEMTKDASGFQHLFDDVKARPEWADMLRSAATEEVRQDMPRIELVIGRRVFEPFAVAELQVGVTFLTVPIAREAMREQVAGKNAPPSPAARKAMIGLNATPAGRSFLAKFSKLRFEDADKTGALVGKVVAPGLLRRFGEKALAAEAARATAAPAPSEADLLGAQLMHRLMEAMGMKAKLQEMGSELGKSFAENPETAEWAPVANAAGVEEIEQDVGLLEAALGRPLGRHFTVAELRAGLAFLDTPAGQDLLATFAARAAGATAKEPTKADQKAVTLLRRDPAGDGFYRKLATLDQVSWDDSLQDVLVAILPGLMKRLGEKLEAQRVAIQAVS